ncbi:MULTISPECIES: flavin reductase family protein [Actinosynnema]|uniref:Flavin reductase n=1 Tax=Actinosynnema pretiosum TaxID=42197 RepID=A0A290ZA62_9PSEU|nr:flavin reductase family protein [Actinosynnema pretiosum]ATE55859.1 flavin reductase [Actinosynnema pretiosum]
MSEQAHVAAGGVGTAEPAGAVDPKELRSVMGRFATGVVVVTTGGEHVHGMTANAFGSVSLDPPLVHVCVARSAVMHRALTSTGRFGVSVAAADQEPAVRHFADRERVLGAAQFDVVDWAPGPLTGAPLLTGALAWLECEVVTAHPAGDHTLFLGRVLGCGSGAEQGALVFHQGRFQRVG